MTSSQDKGQLIYHGRVFDVYEGEVCFPNGRKSRQSWIDHKPCIAVVPVNDAGKLILIRQYRPATCRVLTEIPAGSIDKGEETPEACAQRELAEEIGFQAKGLVKLFEGYLVPGYSNEYMHFFLAFDLFPLALPPDEDEFIETLEVSFTEAEAMIQTGQIIDAKTALGIVLAAAWLKQRGDRPEG
ncbi:MAG: NUDIX hydrolase [Deltaproteobacteria bacterium]|jgi:ADP-ribose pyrophosphatase|nr:NUDIX hydrolase [Deltaproteobacteria bacterium]